MLDTSPIPAIGALHYGKHKDDGRSKRPEQALAEALNESNIPVGTLLVLPEAFERGTNDEYYDPEFRSTEVISTIRRLGEPRHLSFVVGLFSPIPKSGKSHSSAYLLAPNSEPILLSHKHCNDCAPYAAYEGLDDVRAVRYGDIGLAALLCKDAYSEEKNKRLQEVAITRLCDLNNVAHRVLCVPARSKWQEDLVEHPKIIVVLSNGRKDRSSFVRMPPPLRSSLIVEGEKETNQIIWTPLARTTV